MESTTARDYLDVRAWFEDDAAEPALIGEFRTRFKGLELRRETKRGTSVYNGIFNLLVKPETEGGENPHYARFRLSVPMPGREATSWVRKDSVALARLKAVFEGASVFEKETVDRLVTETGVPLRLAANMRAINLSIPKDRAAGGLIARGDRVDVLMTSLVCDGNDCKTGKILSAFLAFQALIILLLCREAARELKDRRGPRPREGAEAAALPRQRPGFPSEGSDRGGAGPPGSP